MLGVLFLRFFVHRTTDAFIFHKDWKLEVDRYWIYPLGFSWIFGLIRFLDDLLRTIGFGYLVFRILAD